MKLTLNELKSWTYIMQFQMRMENNNGFTCVQWTFSFSAKYVKL